MDYLVKSGEFEGPIHVLLDLITGRKLHVSEISLASVTEEFFAFMSEHQLSHSQVSSFVVVASTLLLIKARSLLPQIELTDEEQASITDLTERIHAYQVIQKYAQKLTPIFQKNISFEKKWVDKTPVFAPDTQITNSLVHDLVAELFQAFPILEKLPEKAIKVVVRLEEMIETLTQRIQSGVMVSTKEVMEKYRTATDPVERRQAKVFAVVSFLAILELVKKGIGNVLQQDNFDDIQLSTPSAYEHPSFAGDEKQSI